MFSEIDTKKGVVKTCWSKIRKRVHKVNPEFAKLVDEVQPDDKTMPLYLAYYPYGEYKGDTISPVMPDMHGGTYRLLENEAPKELIKHLGYGSKSAPLAMVLEKSFEVFLDIEKDKLTIPIKKQNEGDIFPLVVAFMKNNLNLPNSLLKMVAGTRTEFILSSLGNLTQHNNLARNFNIKSAPAKSYYDQFYIFKELANFRQDTCSWRGCLMYFSEIWLDKIFDDKSWEKIKLYFYKTDWEKNKFRKNHYYFDFILSIIQKELNLRPNPYYADMAKYIFKVILGESFGFVPSTNENSLPLAFLQKTLVDIYDVQYIPTFMEISSFNLSQNEPVYYSLQHPTMDAFSYHSRKSTSTIFEMHELSRLISAFFKKFQTETFCVGTNFQKIAESTILEYFHNKPDDYNIVRHTSNIYKEDMRFHTPTNNGKLGFSEDAKFLRGCIRIKNSK